MLRPVTHEEWLNVELASKGETTMHRRWPRELVEMWLAEDVVHTADMRPAQERQHMLLSERARSFMAATFITPLSAIFSRRLS
jgi:hypothetical protein